MQLTLDTDTLGQIQAVNRGGGGGGGGVHLANSTIRNINKLANLALQRTVYRGSGGMHASPPKKFFYLKSTESECVLLSALLG